MFREVLVALCRQPIRKYVSAVKSKVKLAADRGKPLIVCKRAEFNLHENDLVDINAKFTSIPLASKGWHHHKSKGDFFTINAREQSSEEQELPDLDLTNLKNYNVSADILSNLRMELDIERLTPIQGAAIPVVIDMNHVLIAAETGCGKTLAYLLPIVQQILQCKHTEYEIKHQRALNSPLALILMPGRELAIQVGEVARKLCAGQNINIKTIIGGNTKQKMMNPEFDDIDILIGTMGAISKLTTTGVYRMHQVRHVVLDEADTLLDDSFTEKLNYFLKKFPFHKNHIQDLSNNIVGTQLILASATMPQNIREILCSVVNTETIQEVVSPNLHRLLPHIKQKFLRMNKSDRPAQLLALVKSELRKHRPIIVFSNKTPTCDFVSLFLNDRGVQCVNLNGDMLMQVRLGQFERFQSGEVNVLSSTDVGSRGLDTTRARHVINFDFPLHISDYIHRCGRIGRVGSHENCHITNFISSLREINLVQKIEHTARIGGVLPDVNGNIANLIKKQILKNLEGIDLIENNQ